MAGKKFDITDPKVSLFMVEMYEKEALLRDTWNRKNKDIIEDAAVLKREPKNYYDTDIISHCLIKCMPATTEAHIESGCNRYKKPITDLDRAKGIELMRHGHSIAEAGLGDPKLDPRLVRPDTDLSLDPIMRPVDEKFTSLLYKKKQYRAHYIAERNKIKPEDKYYFPMCTSWDYGWRLGDSKMKQAPRQGRRGSLTRVLHSRVGPQPDPEHYHIDLGLHCKYF